MSLIRVKDLCFSYAGAPAPALSDIRFSMDEGEYVAIVGANGSGKSTLARCLNGLLSPPVGTVSVDGLDPSDRDRLLDLRRVVSLVFQSPPDQIVASVVEEDVAFGLENLAVPRADMLGRVTEALSAVDLLSERSRPPRFLSAGQEQRLAVAGAIAMRPRCIVFDEATAMIDPVGREAVLAIMDVLHAEGLAILHITHDMGEAARAPRVLALAEGRLVFDGPPLGLFSSPALAAARLGLPDAYRLALALGLEPRLGESPADLGRRLASSSAGLSRPAAVESPRPLPADGEPAFRLSSASMRYLAGTTNERLAVDSVSADLPRGTMIALVGATGSGKSSLLQLLDALAFPSSGRVLSFGADGADPKADVRAMRMRAPLSVQRPESAFFEPFAGDEAAFGPRNQGLSGAALAGRVRAAMEAVGLSYDEFKDRRTRALSGGEKRRLAVAGILSMEPEALLLDEPTSALDPASRADMLALMRSLADQGRSVVLSTHSMEEAAAADLVMVMKAGRLAAYGPPSDIFGPGWDEGWGLSRPCAAMAAAAARAAGLDLPPGLVSEGQLASACACAREGGRA